MVVVVVVEEEEEEVGTVAERQGEVGTRVVEIRVWKAGEKGAGDEGGGRAEGEGGRGAARGRVQVQVTVHMPHGGRMERWAGEGLTVKTVMREVWAEGLTR